MMLCNNADPRKDIDAFLLSLDRAIEWLSECPEYSAPSDRGIQLSNSLDEIRCLMSATPDLLEACKAILYLAQHPIGGEYRVREIFALSEGENLILAITKAEGK